MECSTAAQGPERTTRLMEVMEQLDQTKVTNELRRASGMESARARSLDMMDNDRPALVVLVLLVPREQLPEELVRPYPQPLVLLEPKPRRVLLQPPLQQIAIPPLVLPGTSKEGVQRLAGLILLRMLLHRAQLSLVLLLGRAPLHPRDLQGLPRVNQLILPVLGLRVGQLSLERHPSIRLVFPCNLLSLPHLRLSRDLGPPSTDLKDL